MSTGSPTMQGTCSKNDVRLEGEPAFRAVPCSQLRIHRRRLHPDYLRLGRFSTTLRSEANWRRPAPYSYVRHPQYVGFVLIMFGFLLQWPTMLTLAMFPVLTVMYVRLAKSEEQDSIAEFGDTYREYMPRVPAFFPRLNRLFGSPGDKPSETRRS